MFYIIQEKMIYVGYAIVPLAVALLTPLIFFLIEKNNLRKESKMNHNDFIVSSSMVLCFLLVFFEIIYALILILLNIFEKIDWIQNIICIPTLIFFAFGCYALLKEKKIIKNDTIIYVPIFGKKRIYSFNEIKKVIEISTSRGLTTYAVFTNKKIFSLSNMNVGTKIFISKIKSFGIKIENKVK